MKIQEIKCKSILNKSRLPEGDYVINPYVGCMHGCVYCYARFMKRFTGHTEPWGEFTDVKINAVEVLKKQIPKIRRGWVMLSSVTDPYNPMERKYKLTRNILKVLLEYQFPVSILTKSELVLRDLDLLKKFKECEVGITVTFLDDKHRKRFEPLSSPIDKRIKSLKVLHKNKINTYGFIGPIFPYLVDIPELFVKLIKTGVYRVIFEKLNTNYWYGVEKVLKKHYSESLPKYKEIFFKKNDWHDNLKRELIKLAKKYKVDCSFYFHKNLGEKTEIKF